MITVGKVGQGSTEPPHGSNQPQLLRQHHRTMKRYLPVHAYKKIPPIKGSFNKVHD